MSKVSNNNDDDNGIEFFKEEEFDVGELGMSKSLTLEPGQESIGNLNKSFQDRPSVSRGSGKNEVLEDIDVDLHSDGSSAFSVDSEAAGATERKSRYFEFSDSISFLRVIRLFSILHIIGIGVENQAVPLPVFFRITARGPLWYLNKFYSRPFIDFVYLVQYFLGSLIDVIYPYYEYSKHHTLQIEQPDTNQISQVAGQAGSGLSQGVSGAKSVAGKRMLSLSDYQRPLPEPVDWSVDVNFMGARNWHSIKFFSHFFLGLMFSVLAVSFTLQMWEIKDYTDRTMLTAWLKRYVADGWWRRGFFGVFWNTLKACVYMTLIIFFMFTISNGLNINSWPEPRMIGAALAIDASVIFIICVIAYLMLMTTESIFVKYVSQNVAYTSSIILKKIVKAKVDLGICLVFLIYPPVLYTMIQSVIPVMDWNPLHAFDHRRALYSFVPCYYLAFPPLRSYRLDPESICPVADSAKYPLLYMQRDTNILQCDSYLGITIYIFSIVSLAFVFVGFNWLFYRLIVQSANEFRTSYWVRELKNFNSLRSLDRRTFNQTFFWMERLQLSVYREVREQLHMLFKAIIWLIDGTIWWIMKLIYWPFVPLLGVCNPCITIANRFCGCTLGDWSYEDKLKSHRIKSIAHLDHAERKVFMDDKYETHSLKGDDHHKTIPEHIKDYFEYMLHAYTPLHSFSVAKRRFKRKLLQSDFVVDLRLKTHLMMEYVKSGGRHAKSSGFAGMSSDKHATWRKSIKSSTKFRNLMQQDKRIVIELRRARNEFLANHALTITVFDIIIDTSGLFTLSCMYRFERLEWTSVLVLELTLQALVAGITNYYSHWVPRLEIMAGITVIFGIITYFARPYTEVTDRWLDWLGRLLIVVVFIGIIYVNSLLPEGVLDNVDASLYSPWKSFQFISQMSWLSSTLYLLIDTAMTLFLYVYFFGILKNVGLFAAIRKKYQDIKFKFHDSILDYLVYKLEDRRFGAENILEGLGLIQQWDDIIRDQRRYALMTWPYVRPSFLVKTVDKMFTVKWAAAFNLNIEHLQSSMGLTLLHVTMCMSDTESARWLIHTYPQLLASQDLQRDTPLTISLKECAYCVMKYADFNDGFLDDGTSYSDDAYSEYYQEIDEARELVSLYGEFDPQQAETYNISSKELEFLNSEGYLYESQKNEGEEQEPSFMVKIRRQEFLDKQKSSESKTGSQLAMSQLQDELDAIAVARKEAKKKAEEDAREKASLYAKRFPEDDVSDNFECGQLQAWRTIGAKVPDESIFFDEKDIVDEVFDEWRDNAKDLKYGIGLKSKKIALIDDEFSIPKGHPRYKELRDFDDIKGKGKGAKGLGSIKNAFASIMSGKALAIDMGGGVEDGEPEGLVSTGKSRDEFALQLCKYCEMFLCDEIVASCVGMEWDIPQFKAFNAINSVKQGLLAQQLAFCYNLNPPYGYTRISDWTLDVELNDFDEPHFEPTNIATKAVVHVVNTAHQTIKSSAATLSTRKRLNGKIGGVKSKSESGDVEPGFNDRMIHFLAESIVASRKVLNLDDMELSVYGRVGLRAIVRASRRIHCSFIVPNIFVSPKHMIIRHIDLSRNELDCGDCILIGEMLLYQQEVSFLKLSYNRIGARGLARMLKVLKGHASISTMILDHNRIGPSAGKYIGMYLKQCKTLKILNLSHNRMGELDRYLTLYARERVSSAARDIFWGVKYNTNLHMLDLSYNHLGPSLAKVCPPAVCRHPNLMSLNISGNAIGDERGAAMLFALAGEAGGHVLCKEQIEYYKEMKEKQQSGVDLMAEETESEADKLKKGKKSTKKKKSKKQAEEEEEKTAKPMNVCDFGIADNQLGTLSGHGLGAIVIKNKSLTALDVSGNSLGTDGGLALTDAIEKVYKIYPRDFFKQTLAQIDELQYQGRFAKVRPKLYTHLLNLNMSCNGLTPLVIGSLMTIVMNENNTIVNLDVSHNPFGDSSELGGDSYTSAAESRQGLGQSKSITKLNLAHTVFNSTHMLTLIGGLTINSTMIDLNLHGIALDEPCCLQLSHALHTMVNLKRINLREGKMGPKGGLMVLTALETSTQIEYMDLSSNRFGPGALLPIQALLKNRTACIKTLYLADNDLMDAGGNIIGNGMVSATLTDIDLSTNQFTEEVAEILAAVARGVVVNGKKISDCTIRRFVINDNPNLGARGAKELFRASIGANFEHIELCNIGAGPGSAQLIAAALRDKTLTWQFVDFSGNYFGRPGLNDIFWGLRRNRRIRVFKVGDNKAGPRFATEDDALLKHGISLARSIQINNIIRELDLSYNGLSSSAGNIIFDAMLDNYTIRKLVLRGNVMDDDTSPYLSDMLKHNNVLDYLDIGDNRMGFDCLFSIAEGLDVNRSIQTLHLDYNKFGNAGTITVESFARSIMVNHTLRNLYMDGNKLGPDWIIELCKGLCRNNTLIRVSLRDNRLDPKSGQALIKIFKNSWSLIELGLSADEIGDANWFEHRDIFKSKRAIVRETEMVLDTEVSDPGHGLCDRYEWEFEYDQNRDDNMHSDLNAEHEQT